VLEPESSIVAAAGVVSTTIIGLVTWMFKRQVKRIDLHDGRLNDLERESLSKADLAALESTIVRGNAEIQRTLGSAHKRIDELYRDIPKLPK